MKPLFLLTGLALCLTACNRVASKPPAGEETGVVGTWKLVSNKIIEKGDTVIAYPLKGKEELMIKMFNATHFSFFRHDLSHGKAAEPVYDTGAGTYTLDGADYAEKLEFCNYREWEGHDFKFKLTISNDTLVQRGVEKIDSLQVNREIIETYVRIK